MPEILPVLEGMRQRLATDATWTQGALARRSTGAQCDPRAPEAVSWCILGAAMACAATLAEADAALETLFIVNAADWNDRPSRCHRDVLHAIDSGIDQLTVRPGRCLLPDELGQATAAQVLLDAVDRALVGV